MHHLLGTAVALALLTLSPSLAKAESAQLERAQDRGDVPEAVKLE